eukprot:gene11718-12939_t
MKRFCRIRLSLQEFKLVRNFCSSKSNFSPAIDSAARNGLTAASSRATGKLLIMATSTKILKQHLTSSAFENCGFVSVSGRNKENDDRGNCIALKPGVEYFGVFDGHCGAYAGDFLNRRLPGILKEEINALQLVTVNDYAINGEKLFISAFNKCQKCLKEAIYLEDFDKKVIDRIGSTALVALIINNTRLLISHVGDSRAVLSKSGNPVCLTDDHTPDNEKEVDRIIKSGGWIDWDTKIIPYVNGTLSMTRSFGNFGLTKAGIIQTPYVFQLDFEFENDEFLILCTDGISNYMMDGDMIDLVTQHTNAQDAALALTSAASNFGSGDDTTAIVIRLDAWKNHSNSCQHHIRTSFTRRY